MRGDGVGGRGRREGGKGELERERRDLIAIDDTSRICQQYVAYEKQQKNKPQPMAQTHNNQPVAFKQETMKF